MNLKAEIKNATKEVEDQGDKMSKNAKKNCKEMKNTEEGLIISPRDSINSNNRVAERKKSSKKVIQKNFPELGCQIKRAQYNGLQWRINKTGKPLARIIKKKRT